MIPPADSLYELLPAIQRIRDDEQGGSLKALMAVLAKETDIVESDIAALYENWFIETGEEWVVPYIGDLIGVRGLHPIPRRGFSHRARVANTLAYRRRKGTAAMLEQLAVDCTGWPAHAAEYFELLGWAQNYNHLRLHRPETVDVRRTSQLELLDTAFDEIAHSVDVRHTASRRGRHNLPNIGLFLWRLQAFPLTRVTACALGSGRYTFNPLGPDTVLFNPPQAETEITHLATERNVPGPLRRRALQDELEARRQAIADHGTPSPVFFDDDAVLKIYLAGMSVLPEEILICNLEQWTAPPTSKTYVDSQGVPTVCPIKVAVDPELGRLTLPTLASAASVEVDYAYGFSGNLGGGPYDRGHSTGEEPRVEPLPVDWEVGVSQAVVSSPNTIFPTLEDALGAWLGAPATVRTGRIVLLDSRTYKNFNNTPWEIEIPAGVTLTIVGADLPKGAALALAAPTEQRPHLQGDFRVTASAPGANETRGELAFDGLLIDGSVTVLNGQLGKLRIDHCTLVPAKGGLKVQGQNENIAFDLRRSIVDAIDLPETVRELRVKDCIVGNGANPGAAVTAPGANADLQSSTFFGTASARVIHAGNSIFTGRVTATLRQVGCVRFCFVPPDSPTSRRYRCQPDLAVRDVDPAQKALILARLLPVFTSVHYGDAGYAQLRRDVSDEIRLGAEDGAEMGAFFFLKQPQRETNLRASLDEYLRFGLEAGLIYAT